MNQLASHKAVLLPALPIGAALLAAVAIDRDFWFAVPLAAVLTVIVGGISFFLNRDGRSPLHALIAGAIGWVTSVALLMNLQI